MAVARCCLRRVSTTILQSNSAPILNKSFDYNIFEDFQRGQAWVKKYSTFKSSKFIDEFRDRVNYETVKNSPDWKYVEDMLPLKTVPKYVSKAIYPSGWTPPVADLKNEPYFIARSRNHMISVYLKIGERGSKRTTFIRRIQGDIWKLNEEIKDYLQRKHNRIIATRYNELAGQVHIKGDYYYDTYDWVESKGF